MLLNDMKWHHLWDVTYMMHLMGGSMTTDMSTNDRYGNNCVKYWMTNMKNDRFRNWQILRTYCIYRSVWCRFWCFVFVLYRRSSSTCWSSLCSSWTLFLARNSYHYRFCSKVKLLSAAVSHACKPCSIFSGKIQQLGHLLSFSTENWEKEKHISEVFHK